MKKILLSIAFALMGIASGFAAKAHTGLTTITQSGWQPTDHSPSW